MTGNGEAPVDETPMAEVREAAPGEQPGGSSSLRAFAQDVTDQLRGIGASPALRIAVLVIAVLGNIGFYLPDAPADVGGVSFPGIDKAYHQGAFALTVWAAGRLLAPQRRFPMGWVVLAGLAHAVLIELVQGALLPHRSADIGDVLADATGVALGLLAWFLERRLRGRMADGRMADDQPGSGGMGAA